MSRGRYRSRVGSLTSPTYRRHARRKQPRVALTFDDGPGPCTAPILDALDAAGAPGTFFVVGREIAGREATLARMARGGHEIGNHGRAHARVPGGPLETFRDLRWTGALIRSAAGIRPRLFRPPFGAATAAAVLAARAAGLVTVCWDVDPEDWSGIAPDAIASAGVEHAKWGSIVLLHDGGGERDATVAALPALIAGLRDRGLELATASALLSA